MARSRVPAEVWAKAREAYAAYGTRSALAVLSREGFPDVGAAAVSKHMSNAQVRYSGYARGGRTEPKVVIPPYPEEVEVRAVFLGDTQVPEIDWAAHRAVLEFLSHYIREAPGPAYVFCIGDMLDVATLSRFDIPLEAPTMTEELEMMRRVLEDYREASGPYAHFIWLDGNHEWRIQKAIRANPEIGVMIKPLPELLGFSSVGIEHYIPYVPSPFVDFCGSLLVTHGFKVGANSGYTAHRHLAATGYSTIHGHSHRLGITYKTLYDRMLTGIENGALCVPQRYVTGVADWQSGFTYTRHWGTRFEAWQMRLLEGKGFGEGRWFGA